MKKIIILILCLLPFVLIGQSSDQNYVKKIVYKIPAQLLPDLSTGDDYLAPVADNLKDVNITYYNGLGIPIQSVDYQKSNSGTDIVTHFEYDTFGRQVNEYLPYATSSSSLNYRSSAQTEVSTFYNNVVYENTINPYSQKLFESSPLNKILKQAAPGNDWAMINDHVIRFDYQTNLTTDAVKLFSITAAWNSTNGLYTIPTSLVTTTNYDPNQLYKTITKDENWTSGTNNTTEEFKNKEGKVILKRTYNASDKHDTYYVYDQYGNLTFVLPPLVNTGTTITATILDGLCYQYKYDNHNRLVEKKLPGKQWEFIVYDKLDRVVATGPALSPFTSPTGNGWMITKYDVFNRVVYTGWSPLATINSEARKNLQAQYNAATTNFSETKTATTTNTTVNGVAFRYSNVAIPTTGYHILTVNYYDDYNFPHAPTSIPTSVEGQTVYYNTTVKPKGLPTGSYVRVLESNTMYKAETNYTLYDSKARPIRNYTSNYLGGFTQVDTKLDFIGKTQYTITTHKRLSSSLLIKAKDEFTYTPQDRLLTHTHQIDDGDFQLLAKNEYDELGQLIVKRVGGFDVTGTTPLQKVDYTYNIRGWLKGINDMNNLTIASDPQDLFAFKINYNTVENETSYTGTKLYNGNISETHWRTANDDTKRKYGYQYDNLNRLTNAIYQKPGSAVVVTNSYNESLNYDKNGNVVSLQRTGEYDDLYYNLTTDNLAYYYHTDKPNQLTKVVDNTNNPNGFKDGTNTGDDYVYDNNGNMITDNNKGIVEIVYNHLNLPIKIYFATSNKIEYLYDATGKKLSKQVYIDGTSNTTDYLDGFQYLNTVLEFFPHAEGYVKNTIIRGVNSYNYVFNYTDHLGNIRLSYGVGEGNVLMIFEENNYYPFGLNHKNYNMSQRTYNKTGGGTVDICSSCPTGYKYKFGGNEFQDELGLNVYDYDNRVYDQAMGRFWQMDPLAEQGRRWSPYNYCFDNPIYFQDPDGMWPKIPSWSDIKKSYNQAKTTVSKTYNQAKATVSKTYNEAKTSIAKTYNETKKTVVETTNNVVASTKETLKDGQKWVKDNKQQLLDVAKNLQEVGDTTTTTGLVMAVAGAPLAGIGSSPGLAVATAGGIVGGLGEGLEIMTNLISGDIGETAGGATVYVAGELAGMAVDRAIPGPNPDVSPQVKDFLKAGQKTVKSIVSDGTKDVGNKIKEN